MVMSSLADVAFLLLVFLIVTSTINMNNDMDITVPVSDFTRVVHNERAFDIFIDETGNIFTDKKKNSMEELRILTLQEQAGYPQTIFFIHGEATAEYEKIDGVLELLKQNNIRNVVLTAKKETL